MFANVHDMAPRALRGLLAGGPAAFTVTTALAGLTASAPARAEPYPFAQAPRTEDLARRFPPPPGASRTPAAAGSFGAWLRHLPLLPPDAPVLLFDGRRKARQDAHAAVVDMDVGRRDLQQCADAVMRLRAEYQLAVGQPQRVRFHPDPSRPDVVLAYGGAADDRPRFAKYLTRLFSAAGSASLQAELRRVAGRPPGPGDVLIQGGYPGHAVLVLDAADAPGPDGPRRLLLLGQSYMPAQQFHVLRNPTAASPWYDAAALASPAGLATPEWRPFHQRDVYAFE